jgi:hypothetical protein
MHLEPSPLKRYGGRTFTVAVVAAVGCLVLGQPAVGRGLVLGTIMSIGNFWIMGLMLPLRLRPSRRQSTLLSFLSILIRYGLMGAAVAVAIRSERFDLAAVAVGLLAVPAAILLDQTTAGRNRSGSPPSGKVH